MRSEQLNFDHVIFSGHAVQRMFKGSISKGEVLEVLRCGEVIDSYPDDRPYPSHLFLGFAGSRPLHVVIGVDESALRATIVTAYVPDPDLWTDDFESRREP